MPPKYPRQPTSEELSLWQLAMRDVKKLFGSDNTEMPPPPRVKTHPTPLQIEEPSFGLKAPAPMPPQPAIGLDRRTEERFRKGQMEIEGRLDLHGLTLKEAQPAVRDFIRLSQAAGKRCVLVITGKGQSDAPPRHWYESPKGQIRQTLKHWLDADDLKPLILSVAPAQRHHGGSGAFYVLLRRQR